MTFHFGPFRLEQELRVLRHQEREVSLQPRVFDLLAYLISNRDRVVSKDELLDALWPSVTVTENSLQRAVSTLRSVLRAGGMEKAIRNLPRAGYRFCWEEDVESASAPSATAGPGIAGQVRQAVADRLWQDAVDLFAAADAVQPVAADDLESWAHAVQCLGRPSEAIPVLTRAVTCHARAGSGGCGARAALALSAIHLERGDTAVVRGWLARARDLINDDPDCLAAGELLWMDARLAATAGEPDRARELAARAYQFGREHSDRRIESLGLMYRGFYRMSLGEVRDGLVDQDHAAALALSHKLDPVTGGVLYCNILWACRTFGDWARANEWTLGYQEFHDRNHMEFSGSCQLHRAEYLGVQGSLADARHHIADAIERLPRDAPWALGDAYRILGDLEAAAGDDEAAMAAYQRCYGLGWSPEPGHAMLLLEQEQVAAACASLERSLIGSGWWTLQRRGMLQAHLALALAVTGEKERTVRLMAQLSDGDGSLLPSIKGLLSEASAELALQEGRTEAAITDLYVARQAWTEINSRFNAARLRLRIAEILLVRRDLEGAASEIHAALSSAEAIGSGKLLTRAKKLLRTVGDTRDSATTSV